MAKSSKFDMDDFDDLDDLATEGNGKKDLIPTFEDSNKSFMQFMEAKGAQHLNMLSPEGLEFQAEYLKTLENNNHPLDVARRLSLNPFAAPKDRLAACKLIMTYTMRPIPTQMEITGGNGGPITIDQKTLKGLSDAELDVLAKLLEKANK